MPCLAAVLALISPRLAIVAVWLFSDILSRAFDSWFLPLVGFFLLAATRPRAPAIPPSTAGQAR